MKRYAPWVLACIAVAVGAWLIFPAAVPRQDPVTTLPPPAGTPLLRYSIKAGMAYRYTLSFTQHSITSMLGAPAADQTGITADVNLGIEYRLIGLGHGVGLVLDKIEPASFVVARQSVIPDAKPLLGIMMVADMDSHGHVSELRFADNTPEMVKRLGHLLLAETQVHLGEGPSWDVDETTQHGVAPTRYALAGTTATHASLVKKRDSYRTLQNVHPAATDVRQTVEMMDTIRFSMEGHVLELQGKELIVATTPQGAEAYRSVSNRKLEFLGREPMDVAEVQARLGTFVASQKLMQVVPSRDAREALLKQRVGDMTPEKLVADLLTFGNAEQMPGHNQWLVQATGLLILHPELCERMVEIFQDKALGPPGRALVLDLLVGAGHSAAQRALRTALQTGTARSDPKFAVLFQRLSLVARPDGETLRFVSDRLEQGKGNERIAAIYTLGSAAGQRAKSGNAQEGEEAANKLSKGLESTKEVQEKVAYLEGLGNSGLLVFAPQIASYASNPSAQVRLATANALRTMDSPQTRDTLLTLAQDNETLVQKRAINSMRQDAPLDPQLLAGLLAAVQARRISEFSYLDLVNLLQPHLNKEPIVAEIFNTILQQDLKDPTVKARIRALLGA